MRTGSVKLVSVRVLYLVRSVLPPVYRENAMRSSWKYLESRVCDYKRRKSTPKKILVVSYGRVRLIHSILHLFYL